jgi:hypothetical protein
VTGNTAESFGGGLAVLDGAHATVSFSQLDGNNAPDAGGAIASFGDLVVSRSRVTGNTAHDLGGGVFTLRGRSRITGTVVARNVAGNMGGGIDNAAIMELTG